MSEFINFIEKWPVKEDHDPRTKLRLLQKSLVLVREMFYMDLDNGEYWKKRMDKVREQIRDTRKGIGDVNRGIAQRRRRLREKGKEILKEVL